MKRLLAFVLWMSAGAFALEVSHGRGVPRFRLARVLDPPGISSLDLLCYESDEPQKDPDCFITWTKNRQRLERRRFPIEEARRIVKQFLSSLPKRYVHTPILPTRTLPRLKADTAVAWQAGLGKQEAQGTLSLDASASDRFGEKLVAIEAALSSEDTP